MSKILNKIKEDFLEARKARRSVKAAFLGTIIAEAEQKSTFDSEKNEKIISDQEVIKILKSFEKKTLEFIKIVNSPKSNDELFIIQSYLPKQLSAGDIHMALLRSGKPKNKKDLMNFLKENYSGQYDGKTAAQEVDKIVGAESTVVQMK